MFHIAATFIMQSHLNAVKDVVPSVLRVVHDGVLDAVLLPGPAHLHPLPEEHHH